MRGTEEVMTEHRAIERVVGVVEAAAGRRDEGEAGRPGLFRDVVDFVRNFADRCHHGKEEEHLFPRMEAAGVPRAGGPLAVMLFEHDEGRDYVAAIADAIDAYESGDSSAASQIAGNHRGYG